MTFPSSRKGALQLDEWEHDTLTAVERMSLLPCGPEADLA